MTLSSFPGIFLSVISLVGAPCRSGGSPGDPVTPQVEPLLRPMAGPGGRGGHRTVHGAADLRNAVLVVSSG
ncbi:hypothetical protein GCM10023075_02680 [Streptosporangium album]